MTGLSSIVPQKIAVAFPSRRCAGRPHEQPPQWYLSTVSLADAGFPDLAGSPGTLVLRNEAQALYSTPGGPPTNQGNLDALALQMAKDFCSWRSVSFDRVYNGICAPAMNGLLDEVEWRYDAVELREGTGVDGGPGVDWADAEAAAADLAAHGLGGPSAGRGRGSGKALDPVSNRRTEGIRDLTSRERVVTTCTTRMRAAPLENETRQFQTMDPAQAGCVDSGDVVVQKGPCWEMQVPGAPAGQVQYAKVCLEDGRLAVMPTTQVAVPCGCGCNPSTTKICIAVVDHCTASPISGAVVTVKDSHGTTVGTCTTNGSGQCCVGVTKTGPYTTSISASGYCTRAGTAIIFACGGTSSVSNSLFPTTITALFGAGLCCSGLGESGVGCYPSEAYPVTVSVMQTAGGTFTGSCTITSSAGCSLSLPAPCPGTADNVFSVAFSSPGFITVTNTITLPNSTSGWQCSTGSSALLVTPSSNWCFPGNDCIGVIPGSITVTFSHDITGCGTGPFTLSLYGTSTCQTSYAVELTCAGGNQWLWAIFGTVGTPGFPVCNIVALALCVGPVLFGGGDTCFNGVISGTEGCPIAYSFDYSGTTISVSQ
jgi:hypothetical protein